MYLGKETAFIIFRNWQRLKYSVFFIVEAQESEIFLSIFTALAHLIQQISADIRLELQLSDWKRQAFSFIMHRLDKSLTFFGYFINS